MKVANYYMYGEDMVKYGTRYAIDHTVKMGFDAVEYFDSLYEDRIGKETDCDIKTAKRLLKENNLSVACYSVYIPHILNDGTKEEVLAGVYKEIDYASELESPYFHHTMISKHFWTGDEAPYDEIFDRVAERVDKIAEYCDRRGITCLYEPQGIYFNGLDGLGRLFYEMLGRGHNVGICGDMGNSLFADVNPTDLFRTFKDHIKHIHAKDYFTSYKPISDICKSKCGRYLNDAPLGEGIIDIEGCLGEVRGYDGAISTECPFDEERTITDIAYIRHLYDRVNK